MYEEDGRELLVAWINLVQVKCNGRDDGITKVVEIKIYKQVGKQQGNVGEWTISSFL